MEGWLMFNFGFEEMNRNKGFSVRIEWKGQNKG